MSFLKCGYCGHRCAEGVAHVYWFAPSRQGDVFRFRQRLCIDCLATNVTALASDEHVDELTCSACGISVEHDVFPIYFTYYLKGHEAERGAMALCEEHQHELKLRAAMGALELEDRYINEADARVTEARPAPYVVSRMSSAGSTIPHRSAEDTFRGLGRLDPGPKHGR